MKSFELAKNGFLTRSINLSEITSKSKFLLENSKKGNSKDLRKYNWDLSASADNKLLNLLNKEFEIAGILNESSYFLGKKVSVKRATIIFQNQKITNINFS